MIAVAERGTAQCCSEVFTHTCPFCPSVCLPKAQRNATLRKLSLLPASSDLISEHSLVEKQRDATDHKRCCDDDDGVAHADAGGPPNEQLASLARLREYNTNTVKQLLLALAS